MNKDKRIKKEYERIDRYFEDIAENEKAIITPLLQNAAFMRITLEDLQEIINRDGVVERYQNGANQYGMKQSSAVQSYNALIKNYAAVIKSLSSYLPPEKKPSLFELRWQSETEENEAYTEYWREKARLLREGKFEEANALEEPDFDDEEDEDES